MSETTLTEEIRRLLVSPRGGGSGVSSSVRAQRPAGIGTEAGALQGDTAPPRQRTYVDRTARGPAQRGCPNDYAWRVQDRQEIAAYRESLIDLPVEAGAVQVIDPNLATCWRLRAEGSLTLSFVDPVPVPDLDDYAPTPLYVTSVVFRISRPAGASIIWPAGTLFQKPLRDLAGSEGPLGPAAEATLDEFVAEYWPGDAWSVNSSAWRLA